MPAGAVRRAGVAAVLGLPLLALGGCSGDGSDGTSASCASEVTITGTTYIGGRGEGAATVPVTGTVLHGATLPCADGTIASRPVDVHTIPGVKQADAVVGPGGEVMVAERWWQQPRTALPPELQRYISR
jgi:hypothetical protein